MQLSTFRVKFVLLHDDQGVTTCQQIGIERFPLSRGCSAHDNMGSYLGPMYPVHKNEVSVIGGVRYRRFHCTSCNVYITV